jgi:hypothetical protein
MSGPLPELSPADPEPEEGQTRRIEVAGAERTVRLDDVDDVIGIAAELKNQATEELSVADLEQVASELDIEPAYVAPAVEALEQRRRRAAEEAAATALRRKRLLRRALIAGAALLAVLIAVPLWLQSGLRADLSEVQRQRAQVRNVTERQAATVAQWEKAPAGPDRSAELSGAENRVRIERKRYDDAAARYNTHAGGPLNSVTAALFGLPTQVPLSNEVETW